MLSMCTVSEHLCADAEARGGDDLAWCVEYCLAGGALAKQPAQDCREATLVAMGFSSQLATAAALQLVL